MKTASPVLLPLLRTRTQGEVLAWLLLHPDTEYTLTDLATMVGTSSATVMREVDRLAAAGLVTSRKHGNQRVVKATTDHPVYRPLADLMAVTFGPVGVLRETLTGIDRIDTAFIYGSWAARYHQQPGNVPDDIDVLIVGTPDRDAVYDAVEEAERRLHREVSVRIVPPNEWNADNGAFKNTVITQPTVPLIGETVAV